MRRRKKNKNTGRTKKIALGGILTALAMIFSYIESLIPIPLPVPGVKLGIANIAIISVLYLLGSGPGTACQSAADYADGGVIW